MILVFRWNSHRKFTGTVERVNSIRGYLENLDRKTLQDKGPGFSSFEDCRRGDLPGVPVVKNLPYNAGDEGSIPGRGTKIAHVVGQLSPCATTTELSCLNKRARMLQTTEPTRPGACVPQLEREKTRTPQLERENLHAATREKPARHNKKIPCASTKIPHAATKTRRSQN